MINSDLLAMLAAERAEELRRAAERSRVAAAARGQARPIRFRLGSVTVQIEREAAAYTAPRSVSRPT